MTVASELSEMLEKLKNNDFSPQVFKIYAEVPVEFEIWKHENQVFWARLVQAFFERIKERPKQQVFVESDEESVEDSDHFVVARWTIN
jgi:AAA+ superfamily predicted ATPase